MILPHSFSSSAVGRQAHLRIIETTDLHAHILPYDYYADRPSDTLGLARTAALIDIVRAEAANSLLVDNGDFLQGSPMGDYLAFGRGMKPGDLHPIIGAMNALRYDAGTLGNHEFNYGLQFLENTLAGANFPVVCANVATRQKAAPTADTTLQKPYVLLDRLLVDGAGGKHPIRIGLIGFVPPQIMAWDRDHLERHVTARDIVATAASFVPRMKEDGADLIIALAHSGIGAAETVEGMENACVPLARLAGIDALVTGHSHLVFPSPRFAAMPGVDVARGTIGGKPAVMGGFWGSHVGLIDLLLERDGGGWHVINTQSEARPIANRETDGRIISLVDTAPAIQRTVAKDHQSTLEYMRQAVGWSQRPLHSFFALVADAPSVQIVCRAQEWYIRQRLVGTLHAGLPLLSAAAPFKAGGRAGPDHYTDVPEGGLVLRHVADLYAFPNTIRAVRVTGIELADWLERSAAIFNRITPGEEDQLLLDPEFPSYNFDVISGVTYRIDPSQPARFNAEGDMVNPAAHRIGDLQYQGAPVTPEAEFIVATNNYRITGWKPPFAPSPASVVFSSPETNRDILLRYITETGTLDMQPVANWRFVPLPGTSLLFDSGARAGVHLAELGGLRIEAVGPGPGGFSRFRIRG